MWLSSVLLAALAFPNPVAANTPPSESTAPNEPHLLPEAPLAARYFGGEAPWFRANIPFFDCSDPKITETYYYRWKLYKAHLRDIGDRGYIVTEFLDDVSWSLKPYESLNDATGFHIREGRWLRDPGYVDDYIDFMYHGGNDRHFSEAIAAAAYDRYLADGDRAFAVKNLEEMKRIARQWDDHYDATKGLFFIEPLLDATEYTISSTDASGGKDGFRGGDAFRPTINSFMFANDQAISRLSALVGDTKSSQEFAVKAAVLRDRVQQDLWNTPSQHFIDRYKVSNQYVHDWDTIRGRELAGYTPWYFDLPDQKDARYSASWQHLLAPDQLGGAYGIRTVEPSYEYYMRQYRYDREDGINKRECQWNGPSWPFQTTLALGGLANLLNDYPKQNVIGAGDYLRLLRQYTQQHYIDGVPDLQEDYDPDTGKVIVGLNRSHHYNHSGYNDLIITGLAGLRPRADDMLEVNPLIPIVPAGQKAAPSLSYLCLENVPYHGRLVTILYDRDGSHYHSGTGLSVWVNGRLVVQPSPLGRKLVKLPGLALPVSARSPTPANLAVNLRRTGFPAPMASINAGPTDLYQGIDGRVWFYPNIRNYWTNAGSNNASDWYGIDFGLPKEIRSLKLYFFADGKQFSAPTRFTIQSWTGEAWADMTKSAKSTSAFAGRVVENGETTIAFAPVRTSRVRILFDNSPHVSVALTEMKAFGTETVAARPLKKTPPGSGMPLSFDNFTDQNSSTGVLDNVRWRDAVDGGFFSFDMKPTVGDSNCLVVTYWGSDAGNRRFEIFVDGVKTAEQTLENNQLGEFFDVAYPLPPGYDHRKASVSIRFQAKPGATAGGVFGIRLVRSGQK